MDAILKQTEDIDTRFTELGVTVERGWTAVGNELLRIIGLLNDKLKITETISSILKDVSDFMSDTGQASTALDVAKERVTLLENRLAGLKATMDSPVWGTIAGIFEDYPALIAKTEKELSLMRDAVSFLEAETGDLSDTLDNTVERFANWDKALEEVNKELKATAKANKDLQKTFDKGTPVAATQAIRDLLRGLGSDIDDLIQNQELFGLKAEESGRKVETQFINVTETIQNRLQPVVADFYESMFGGKALNSVRDFLNSLKDMFIRVFAEIAAKITINKLFGGLLGGLGISIGGSAAGGAGAALGLGGIGAALKGGASWRRSGLAWPFQSSAARAVPRKCGGICGTAKFCRWSSPARPRRPTSLARRCGMRWIRTPSNPPKRWANSFFLCRTARKNLPRPSRRSSRTLLPRHWKAAGCLYERKAKDSAN
jgi:hypothetical protein